MNIRDIAKLAGVSASTVSKVMNGKDRDISEETRKKVLDVIEQEHYIPYLKYLEKEGMKNHLIGMILRRENQIRESIVEAAEQTARQNGYGLIIGYADSMEDTRSLVNEMRSKKVSGFLIDSKKVVVEDEMQYATVYLNETKEFEESQKATFYYRLHEAGKLATEELLKAGHQKIACIIRKEDKSILNGYKLAMQDHSLRVQSIWMYEADTEEEVENFEISQMLSENVTAVVCGTPKIACCVYRTLQKSKTSVPEEISIISVGDGKELKYVGDGITAVRFPASQMTMEAMEYLLDMVNGEKKIEVTRRFMSQIISRNSIAKPSTDIQGEKIIVVGSMNLDVTIEVDEIPGAGENQMASRIYVYPGGKGANQAVGVGKLGGQCYMIGCLGNDMDGKQIYSSLTENYVHMDGVLFDSTLPSGKAYIHVGKNGESAITVYAGANRNLSVRQISKCGYLFQKAKYCLLSTEIPESIVAYTIKFSKRNETEIILKPTSGWKIKDDLLPDVTYIVPNEKELGNLCPGEGTIEEKAELLHLKGVENVIVTLGAKGCYLKNSEYSMYFEGTGFEAVDTTGGADSFISALAVYLSEGRNLLEAIDFAIYASGISVTRHGVQPAMPDRKAVDIYEEEIYLKYRIRKGENEK